MAILSLQSSVAYGHVGNAAAVFCLRRTGHDVWPIDTVAFSNHPGYGTAGGRVRPAGEVADIVAGLGRLGVLRDCRAVLSGYLGRAETGAVLLDAVSRVRSARPDALFCCDPVMGDRGPGLYVPEAVVAFFRTEALPAADILVPNHFEFETLVGRTLPTTAGIRDAATSLLDRGPHTVVVTSVETEDTGTGRIATVAVTRTGCWRVVTPRLPLRAHGTGDVFAALLLARLLTEAGPAEALSGAVSSVYAVVEATVAADADELRLVSAQERLAAPATVFRPEAVP